MLKMVFRREDLGEEGRRTWLDDNSLTAPLLFEALGEEGGTTCLGDANTTATLFFETLAFMLLVPLPEGRIPAAQKPTPRRAYWDISQ